MKLNSDAALNAEKTDADSAAISLGCLAKRQESGTLLKIVFLLLFRFMMYNLILFGLKNLFNFFYIRVLVSALHEAFNPFPAKGEHCFG